MALLLRLIRISACLQNLGILKNQIVNSKSIDQLTRMHKTTGKIHPHLTSKYSESMNNLLSDLKVNELFIEFAKGDNLVVPTELWIQNSDISLTNSQFSMILLTHISLETPKRVIGKHWRPRSDAAECGI